MKIAIMTDTNSGLTISKGKELGIFVLPMPVIIDGKCYLENIDITTLQIYEAMDNEKSISTSQPAPGDIINMWNDIFDAGYDEIIYIPMSSSLSGSYHSALLLAEDFDSKVHVIDNHRISATQLQSVLDAKKMADNGMSVAEIEQYLNNTSFQASIYLTAATLKYLQMGGRLSSSAALLGNVLNIKPILTFQGEKIESFSKARGMKTCEHKMIEALRYDISHKFKDIPPEKLVVLTAGSLRNSEDIEHCLEQMRSGFPNYDVYYSTLPCSIVCHIGPDCLGMGICVNHK